MRKTIPFDRPSHPNPSHLKSFPGKGGWQREKGRSPTSRTTTAKNNQHQNQQNHQHHNHQHHQHHNPNISTTGRNELHHKWYCEENCRLFCKIKMYICIARYFYFCHVQMRFREGGAPWLILYFHVFVFVSRVFVFHFVQRRFGDIREGGQPRLLSRSSQSDFCHWLMSTTYINI